MNVRLSAKGSKIYMRITPSSLRQFVPSILLAEALKRFEDAFGVSLSCSVAAEKEVKLFGKIKEKVVAR
jgi:hypothetical protein